MIGIGGGTVRSSVTGGAILAEPLELPVLVAVRAKSGLVLAREGKELMDESGGLPGRSAVTTLAVLRPAVGQMVGALGLCERLPVAGDAVRAGSLEIAHLRPRMAGPATDAGVRTDEREPRHGMLRDDVLGLPGPLVVAGSTVRSELTFVPVLVAATASTCGKGHDRSAVVVASEAFGALVGAVQCRSGLLLVIEAKVLPDLVPAVPLMADAAVIGEFVMRHDGSSRFLPAIDRRLVGAPDRRPEEGAGQGEDHEKQDQPDLAMGDLVPGGNVFHESEPRLDVEAETQCVLVVAEAVVDVEDEVGGRE